MIIVKRDWPEVEFMEKKKEEIIRKNKENEERKDEEKDVVNDENLFCIRLNNSKAEVNKEKVIVSKEKGKVVEEDGTDRVGGKWCRVRPKAPAYKLESRVGGRESGDLKLLVQGRVEKQKEAGRTEVNCDKIREENGWFVEKNPMTIVPYNGGILNEVTNKLSGLGLKREAVDPLESGQVKKRRIVKIDVIQKPEISIYASKLRKTKEKAKRGARRKGKLTMEEVVEDIKEGDMMMEENNEEGSLGEKFVFRASKEAKRGMNAEGWGGYPKTATKEP